MKQPTALYCPRCRGAGRSDRNLTFTGTPCTDPYSAWLWEDLMSRRGEGGKVH